MKFTSQIMFAVTINLFFTSCGGGGNDNTLAKLVRIWNGSVTLTSNGCPRDIPAEFQTLTFNHQVSENLDSPGQATITLTDENIPCKDIGADQNSDHFAAVCPDGALPGFLPDLDCQEQRVWEYKLVSPDSDFVDVVRTAYVHCSKDGVLQLACPVVYEGGASA